MTDLASALAAEQSTSREGKYLTFAMGEEVYGLEILKVREIIGMMEITAVARTPEFVRGVINLRGKIIPVIDLRRTFQMDDKEQTRETCIVVVDIAAMATGLVVDRVEEVLEIAEGNIEDTPSFGTNVSTEFILGIGKTEDQVTILLDINKVLLTEDLDAIRSMSQA